MRYAALLLAGALGIANRSNAQGARTPGPSPRFFLTSSDSSSATRVMDPSLVPVLRQRVSIAAGQHSRVEILRTLSKVTGLHFVYETPALAPMVQVPVRTDSTSLSSLLEEVLSGTGLDVLLAANSTVILAKGTRRTQVVRGRVTAGSGEPIAAADIIVTMAPNRELFRGISDSAGQYAVAIANGTGDFLLYVGAPGRSPFRRRINGTVNDSVFIENVLLSSAVQSLSVVRTIAQRTRPLRGEEDRTLVTYDGSAQPVTTLTGALSPDQMGDLNAMAATTPGIVLTPSGASAFGLDPSQNRATLNGMPFDGTSLPRGMSTTTAVVTNMYDPTIGGFAGAGIIVTIRPGSTLPYQRADVSLDAPRMQAGGALARQSGQRFAGVNGAYTKTNELSQDLWVYNAGLQLDSKSAFAPSLLSPGALLLQRDSVDRFTQVANRYAIPVTGDGLPSQLTTNTVTAAFRIDRAQAFEFGGLARDTKPRVGIVGQGSFTHTGEAGAVETGLPSHAGQRNGGNAAVQLNYSRFFGPDGYYLSEGRTSVAIRATSSSPYLMLPEARVHITSTLPDGTSDIQSLLGGGSASGTSSSLTWTWAASNDVQFSPANHLAHRIKMTAGSELTGFRIKPIQNAPGGFGFNSLADFDANAPSLFTRTVSAPERSGGAWAGSIAVADYFAYTPNLTFTFGPRIEVNRFIANPLYNPLLDQLLATRTDVAPNAFHISPRFGFRWLYVDMRQGGTTGGMSSSSLLGSMAAPPKGVLSGGIGEFRSSPSASLLADPIGNTGIAGNTVQRLACIGAATPVPDWRLYTSSPGAIPTTCTGGNATALADGAPGVRVIDPAFDIARSWRGNLMWASARSTVFYSITATYALNLDQSGLYDVNFAGSPRFTLSNEAARPVFAGPSSIVDATGAVSATDARRTSAFGSVISQRSDLRSVTKQLRINVAPYSFLHLGSWALNSTYTYQAMRTQSRGFDGSTASDPRVIEWSAGASPTHMLQTQLGYVIHSKKAGYFSVTAGTTLTSGFRYTPVVASDINGDGLANDRAFVFDEKNAPGADVASAMHDLLLRAPDAASECLRAQVGTIAGRNSCRQPYTFDMNLLTAWNHQFGDYGRGVRLALNFQNPLGGIDQLVHGADRMHGWGARAFPDPVLLYATGFNAQSHRFQYQVNPRFGDSRSIATGLQNPFRLSLFASFDLTRPSQELRTQRYLRPTRSAPGVRPNADTILARLRNTGGGPLDPLQMVLMTFSDSLLLSPPQIEALQAAIVETRQRNDSTWRSVARELADLPETFDLTAISAKTQQSIQQIYQSGASQAILRKILSPLQLRLLPSYIF